MPGRTQLSSWYVAGSFVAAIVFVGGTMTVLHGPPIFAEDDGLGTGLFMFAVYGLSAFLWGTVEGWRRVPLKWVAVRWAAVGAVTGASIIISNYWGSFNEDAGPFAAELVESVAFFAVPIAGTASLGSILGERLRSSRRTRDNSPPDTVA